jgi:hypothetical protein
MDNIDGFFDVMFSDDKDLKKFRILAAVELDEMQETFRAKINVVVNEMKHFIIKQHAIREEELKMFNRCLVDSKTEMDNQSIVRIHQFQRDKKKVII